MKKMLTNKEKLKLTKTNHLKHCSECGQIKLMLRNDLCGFCPLCFNRVYFFKENAKKYKTEEKINGKQ